MTLTTSAQLCGERICLRLLQKEYIDAYLAQFTEAVRKPLRVQDPLAERQYLEQALVKQKAGNTYFYLIFDKITESLLGAVEIRNPETSRGQLYTWLHHDFWGKGLFQEAIQLAAHDYFARTQAHYFDATVDVNNHRSYKALKKAGFADLSIQQGAWEDQFVLLLRNKKES